MSSKDWRNLLAFNSVVILLAVFVWLKSPAGRLALYEWKGVSRLDARQRATRAGDIVNLARSNPRLDIQQRAVRLLIEPSPHPFLVELPSGAFDAHARAIIHRRVMARKPDGNDVFLAGVIEDRAAIPHLRQLKMPEAQMALARMGNKAAIKISMARLLREVKPESTGNLFRQLDYIRQPESISVLTHYVFSEKRVQICGNGLQQIPDTRFEAMGAAHLLSQSLEGWPENPGGLDAIRNWLRSQTHIRIKR